MPEEVDYCQMVDGIEADPHAVVKDLTVGKMLGLRVHVPSCTRCSEAVERISRRFPLRDSFYEFNMN